MKSKYEEWLRNNIVKKNGEKYSESTIYKYTSSIDIIEKEFNVRLWNYSNEEELINKKNKLFNDLNFIKKNSKGNNMYSRSVELFVDFVCSCNISELHDEIKEIEDDIVLSLEEKNGYIESLCNIRNPYFQKNFRSELIKEFHGKCALCQINDLRMLIASHILPYSECTIKSDMYKSYNGLLLCVLHDALFDKKLISFNNDGEVIISKTIDKELYMFFNITSNMKLPRCFLIEERKKYLAEHLNSLKENDINSGF